MEQLQTRLDNMENGPSSSQPTGCGVAMSVADGDRLPCSVQAFSLRPKCENGLRNRFLDEMLVYLPVRKNLDAPADVMFHISPTKHIAPKIVTLWLAFSYELLLSYAKRVYKIGPKRLTNSIRFFLLQCVYSIQISTLYFNKHVYTQSKSWLPQKFNKHISEAFYNLLSRLLSLNLNTLFNDF